MFLTGESPANRELDRTAGVDWALWGGSFEGVMDTPVITISSGSAAGGAAPWEPPS